MIFGYFMVFLRAVSLMFGLFSRFSGRIWIIFVAFSPTLGFQVSNATLTSLHNPRVVPWTDERKHAVQNL